MAGERIAGWLLCAAFVLPAWLQVGIAKDTATAPKVEASTLITGRVTIELDGTVSDWTVDQREKLSGAVTKVIDAAAPGWRFEPIIIEGKPVRGSARMSLLMVAERLDGIEEERYRVSIRGGHFGRDAVQRLAQVEGQRPSRHEPPDDQVVAIRLRPPGYPGQALSIGVQGTVYLALRVGRSGRVEESMVEQVNLLAVASDRSMAYLRDLFAMSAIEAARRWTFRPPTRGESVDDDNWTVRVPVDYRLGGQAAREYGHWEAYVPGPRNRIPWRVDSPEGADIRPDTLVAGQVYQIGTDLRLLSPLEGG